MKYSLTKNKKQISNGTNYDCRPKKIYLDDGCNNTQEWGERGASIKLIFSSKKEEKDN